MININPVNNSNKATKDARAGDRSKYSINPWGGKGNLPRPWIIKAIPIPNLKNKDANASILEKKLFTSEQIFLLIGGVYFLIKGNRT